MALIGPAIGSAPGARSRSSGISRRTDPPEPAGREAREYSVGVLVSGCHGDDELGGPCCGANIDSVSRSQHWAPPGVVGIHIATTPLLPLLLRFRVNAGLTVDIATGDFVDSSPVLLIGGSVRARFRADEHLRTLAGRFLAGDVKVALCGATR